MILRLLTEHHLEFVSLKVGCIGSSESTLVKMPHCWKSHVTAQYSHYVDATVVVIGVEDGVSSNTYWSNLLTLLLMCI